MGFTSFVLAQAGLGASARRVHDGQDMMIETPSRGWASPGRLAATGNPNIRDLAMIAKQGALRNTPRDPSFGLVGTTQQK